MGICLAEIGGVLWLYDDLDVTSLLLLKCRRYNDIGLTDCDGQDAPTHTPVPTVTSSHALLANLLDELVVFECLPCLHHPHDGSLDVQLPVLLNRILGLLDLL